jgi:hypothetical protein
LRDGGGAGRAAGRGWRWSGDVIMGVLVLILVLIVVLVVVDCKGGREQKDAGSEDGPHFGGCRPVSTTKKVVMLLSCSKDGTDWYMNGQWDVTTVLRMQCRYPNGKQANRYRKPDREPKETKGRNSGVVRD